jgi:hypothetical protein
MTIRLDEYGWHFFVCKKHFQPVLLKYKDILLAEKVEYLSSDLTT